MPIKRTYAPKRRQRRPTVAKAKKVIGRYHKKRAAKNMDTFSLKCKSEYQAIPSQGITVTNYVYQWAPMLGSGNLLMNSEFSLYRLQYDKFRVNRVTMRVVPKANVFDAAKAQEDVGLTLTGDGLVHTVIDRDGHAPSSITALSRYPSYRAYSVLKPFQRSYSVKYPTGVWIDCQDPSMSNSQAIMNTLGLAGGVTIYAEDLVEDSGELLNEPWATVEISWDVVFTGKTSASIGATYDEAGNVTGVTLVPFEATPNLDLSTMVARSGTLGDKRVAPIDLIDPPVV